MDLVSELRNCQKVSDFYRLRIIIENICTPSEVALIYSLSSQFSLEVQSWLTQKYSDMEKGHEAPISYERKPCGPNAELYCYAGPHMGARQLLINFCGGYPFRPLAMPMAVFLQHVPIGGYDVLNLRDPLKSCFLQGVQGYADSLPALLDRIGQDFGGNYQLVRCCGISAGAYATLMCAELLNVSKALVFSGSHPAYRKKMLASLLPQVPGILAKLERLLSNGKRAGNLLLVHGANNAVDGKHAALLQQSFPRLAIGAIPDISSHLVPNVLLECGQLKAFLNAHLFNPVPIIQEG